MTRLYEPYAYSEAPRAACFWTTTQPPSTLGQPAAGDITTDVAIIGGGVTGLSAALHLAEAGEEVAVLDAHHIGWGASGRAGGFCCLGGGKISNATLTRRYGAEGRQIYRRAEVAAVNLVETLIDRHSIDVSRHSDGETLLAHTPRQWTALQKEAREVTQDYGVEPSFVGPEGLRQAGLNGPFHGAMTIPIGFGVNPLAYTQGLARAASDAGAALYDGAAVSRIETLSTGFRLTLPEATVQARRLIVATNGYSSEDVPDWLRARLLPLQSNILVTRPLNRAEQDAQGWTSDQMCYDTRHLLHYFRLMPDGRFLFGMRGGVYATPSSTARLRAKLLSDFRTMFPAWAEVEIEHVWSGLVCLARKAVPYVGPIPEMPGAYTALAYHGNGIAMGTYAGRLLADLVCERRAEAPYPDAFQDPLGRFPLGRHRRALLLAVNAALSVMDR